MESEENQHATLVSEAVEEADTIESTIQKTAIEDEENQYVALVSEEIESADAVQSSIRETAIEIGVPLEMGTSLH
jgi:hypothetical protein